MGSDCLLALNNLFVYKNKNPDQPHYDLLQTGQRLLEALRATWRPRHIDSHQDRYKEKHEIDDWGRWNIQMDTLSKRHQEVNEGQQRDNYDLPLNQYTWSFEHAGVRIQR